VKGHPFEQGFDLRLVPNKLGEPLRWSEPKMIFVNSMSDLFHDGVPLAYIEKVVATMRLANWHTYQVLSKRSERLRELLCGPLRPAASDAHIWWGVSVEDRKYGLPRIADLQATPAAVRFLSVEPLLEDVGKLPLDGISWVIVGGESGPGARPMKEEWVLSIRAQCKAANVPFFFKQWGGVRKKAAGRTLQGRTHDGFPTRVHNPTLPALLRLKHALEIETTALDIVASERTYTGRFPALNARVHSLKCSAASSAGGGAMVGGCNGTGSM
jgi:protein gp37